MQNSVAKYTPFAVAQTPPPQAKAHEACPPAKPNHIIFFNRITDVSRTSLFHGNKNSKRTIASNEFSEQIPQKKHSHLNSLSHCRHRLISQQL